MNYLFNTQQPPVALKQELLKQFVKDKALLVGLTSLAGLSCPKHVALGFAAAFFIQAAAEGLIFSQTAPFAQTVVTVMTAKQAMPIPAADATALVALFFFDGLSGIAAFYVGLDLGFSILSYKT